MVDNRDKWDWKKSRGGFGLPGKVPFFISKDKYFLGKAIDAFMNQGKSSGNGGKAKNPRLHQDHLATVGQVFKFLTDAGITPAVGGKIIAIIAKKGMDKLINGNDTTVPLLSEYRNTKSETKLIERHVVRCLCGKKSTSSVLNVIKTQGTNNKLLYSTYRDDVIMSDEAKLVRSEYLQKFGFNQKLFVMLGPSSHITLGDYANLYNLNLYKDNEFAPQVPYGLVVSEQCNILLHNSDSYNGMMVKIHLCSFKSGGMTVRKLYIDTFNSKADLQKPGRIPIVYQYGDLTESANMYSMVCSSNATLMKSGNFKNEVIVTHTYKKRLDPGDIFDFRFKNQCGPGIRLDLLNAHLNRYSRRGMDEPSDYFFIIEAFGYESECIEFATNNRYLGNSPGWLNVEFTKSLEYCIQNVNMGAPDLLEQNVNSEPVPAIKLYRRDLGKKEFNVNVSMIGKPGGSAKYGIVSYTTQFPVYSEDSPSNIPKEKKNDVPSTILNSRMAPVVGFDEYLNDSNEEEYDNDLSELEEDMDV